MPREPYNRLRFSDRLNSPSAAVAAPTALRDSGSKQLRIRGDPRDAGCQTHQSDPPMHVPRMPHAKIRKYISHRRFIITNHKPVGILKNFFEPKTNSSTEDLRNKIAVSPYPVVIVDVLHRAVRRPRLYEGLSDNFLSAVEFGLVSIPVPSLPQVPSIRTTILFMRTSRECSHYSHPVPAITKCTSGQVGSLPAKAKK